jgi:hypothetical protein
MQYLFAKDWPLKVYFAVVAILGVWVAVVTCHPSVAMFRDWLYLLLFIVSIVVAPVLFCFLSLPCACMVLGPLYYFRARLNGAPFRVGDRVRILVGPHRDRIVQVYDVWGERRQVRVDLDAQTEKDVTDVFSFTQICRERVG